MTIFEARSAAEVTCVQLDERVSLYPHNVFKPDDDGDCGYMEPIGDMQYLSCPSASAVSDLQNIK